MMVPARPAIDKGLKYLATKQGREGFWGDTSGYGGYPVCMTSLAGLALAVSAPKKQIHNWVRIHSLLVSMACCVVTLFLSAWHLIGLRLWAP